MPLAAEDGAGAATTRARDMIASLMCTPSSPLRPDNMLLPATSVSLDHLLPPVHSDGGVQPALRTPSFVQLRRRLLHAIGEEEDEADRVAEAAALLASDPLAWLSLRVEEMATCGEEGDLRGLLMKAQASLAQSLWASIEDPVDADAARRDAAPRACALLHDYCAKGIGGGEGAPLVLSPSEVLAAHEREEAASSEDAPPSRPDVPTAQARLHRLLGRLDLQIQLRLSLAALGVSTGAATDPLPRKAYAELKKLMQLYRLKMMAAHRAASQPPAAAEDAKGERAVAAPPPPAQDPSAPAAAAAAAAAASAPPAEEEETAPPPPAAETVSVDEAPSAQGLASGGTAAAATTASVTPMAAAAAEDATAEPPRAPPPMSLDQYIHRSLAPRYSDALPQTIKRLSEQFCDEQLTPSAAVPPPPQPAHSASVDAPQPLGASLPANATGGGHPVGLLALPPPAEGGFAEGLSAPDAKAGGGGVGGAATGTGGTAAAADAAADAAPSRLDENVNVQGGAAAAGVGVGHALASRPSLKAPISRISSLESVTSGGIVGGGLGVSGSRVSLTIEEKRKELQRQVRRQVTQHKDSHGAHGKGGDGAKRKGAAGKEKRHDKEKRHGKAKAGKAGDGAGEDDARRGGGKRARPSLGGAVAVGEGALVVAQGEAPLKARRLGGDIGAGSSRAVVTSAMSPYSEALGYLQHPSGGAGNGGGGVQLSQGALGGFAPPPPGFGGNPGGLGGLMGAGGGIQYPLGPSLSATPIQARHHVPSRARAPPSSERALSAGDPSLYGRGGSAALLQTPCNGMQTPCHPSGASASRSSVVRGGGGGGGSSGEYGLPSGAPRGHTSLVIVEESPLVDRRPMGARAAPPLHPSSTLIPHSSPPPMLLDYRPQPPS